MFLAGTMMMLYTITIFLFGLIWSSEQATVTKASNLQIQDDVRLFDHIKYSVKKSREPYVRPAGRNISALTEVKLSMSIINLLNFDEETGVIETLVWFQQAWKDRNLQWDPAKFGGLRKMSLPNDKFWKPDIELYNSRTGKTDFDQSVRLLVFHDGRVMWIPALKTETDCDMKNGTWTCMWKFGSWTYDGHEVSLSNSPSIDLHSFRPSRQGWKLRSAKAKTNQVYYPCCPEPYPDVKFEITLSKD